MESYINLEKEIKQYLQDCSVDHCITNAFHNWGKNILNFRKTRKNNKFFETIAKALAMCIRETDKINNVLNKINSKNEQDHAKFTNRAKYIIKVVKNILEKFKKLKRDQTAKRLGQLLEAQINIARLRSSLPPKKPALPPEKPNEQLKIPPLDKHLESNIEFLKEINKIKSLEDLRRLDKKQLRELIDFFSVPLDGEVEQMVGDKGNGDNDPGNVSDEVIEELDKLKDSKIFDLLKEEDENFELVAVGIYELLKRQTQKEEEERKVDTLDINEVIKTLTRYGFGNERTIRAALRRHNLENDAETIQIWLLKRGRYRNNFQDNLNEILKGLDGKSRYEKIKAIEKMDDLPPAIKNVLIELVNKKAAQELANEAQNKVARLRRRQATQQAAEAARQRGRQDEGEAAARAEEEEKAKCKKTKKAPGGKCNKVTGDASKCGDYHETKPVSVVAKKLAKKRGKKLDKNAKGDTVVCIPRTGGKSGSPCVEGHVPPPKC